MLDKFLNKKVKVLYGCYEYNKNTEKGTITRIDENFIELDNDTVIAIKHIFKINSL